MNNTQKLIKILEDAGKSPYYVIGHLQGVLMLLERESSNNEQIIKDSVRYASKLMEMETAELNKLKS